MIASWLLCASGALCLVLSAFLAREYRLRQEAEARNEFLLHAYHQDRASIYRVIAGLQGREKCCDCAEAFKREFS